MHFQLCLLVLASTATATVAAGQSALIRVGDPAPGGVLGQVDFIRTVAVNDAGGFATAIRWGDSGNDVDGIWGSLTPGTASVIRTLSTIGSLTQTALGSGFGINDTSVIYAATVSSAGSTSSKQSIWIDGTLVVLQDDPRPGAADFWRWFQSPAITSAGTPTFVAGLQSSPGTIPNKSGFFAGLAPLYLTGEMAPNVPAVISNLGIDSESRTSPNGVHHIVGLHFNTAIINDNAVALDGTGLFLGGTLARRAEVVPASIGGVGGETWFDFYRFGINNSASYFIAANTTGPTNSNDVMVRDGVITLREGQTLDGETLVGSVSHASMNSSGQLAFVWPVGTPFQSSDALFVEDELIIKVGDDVDWDGDGQIDAGFPLLGIQGSSIALTNDGALYFVGSVDDGGATPKDAFFVVQRGNIGATFCTSNPNSSGATAVTGVLGSPVASDNNVTLSVRQLPPLTFGVFVVSSMTDVVALGEGVLCLGGTIGRYQQPHEIFQASLTGSASLPIDLTTLPQGGVVQPVLAGETWYFQAWFRDIIGGAQTSNLASGSAVTFQ